MTVLSSFYEAGAAMLSNIETCQFLHGYVMQDRLELRPSHLNRHQYARLASLV